MKLLALTSGFLAACAFLEPQAAVAQSLTIPNSNLTAEEAANRSSAIAAYLPLIANVNRTLPIGGVNYPFYNGPVASSGSLTQQIQASELAYLIEYRTAVPTELATLLATMLPNITTLDGYAAFYEAANDLMATPSSTDRSDKNFGMQRITFKGFNLKRIQSGETQYVPQDSTLTSANVVKVCGSGVTLKNIASVKQLFVQDFSDYAQWNDPAQASTKYNAPLVGYFCYNKQQKQLLPLAIKVISTSNASQSITYTPFDTANEWALAKMALDAVEFNYQQFQHLAETHALTISLRVELFRHMSSDHPLSALFMHHIKADFGLELQATTLLLNTSTVVDLTFGFGASGAARFLANQQKNVVSIKNGFATDIETRGLSSIPTHKYAIYGKLYYDAIRTFVTSYVKTYYPTKSAITGDSELQSWTQACAQVPHLRDFPAQLKSYDDLITLVTYFVFQSAVKHHAMNGAATWESLALPYSGTAIWKAMPTAKLQVNETLDLTSYVTPKTLAPTLIALAAMFNRVPPESESLLSAYKVKPFTSETVLSSTISKFESTLSSIDSYIVAREQNETWPYYLLRPGHLAFCTWI